jgi:hypothetical protein
MARNDGIADFFTVVVDAVRGEDTQLRILLKDRLGYTDYAPGIETAFETGVVYVIFKALLASPFAQKWTVHWEHRVRGSREHTDLVYQRHHFGGSAAGIEVKWWSKGGAGVLSDCRKLMRNPALTSRGVLVLHVWLASPKHMTLKRLLERARKRQTFKDVIADMPNYEELDVLSHSGVPARLGIALLETWEA